MSEYKDYLEVRVPEKPLEYMNKCKNRGDFYLQEHSLDLTIQTFQYIQWCTDLMKKNKWSSRDVIAMCLGIYLETHEMKISHAEENT
jgi:hypothetical protein